MTNKEAFKSNSFELLSQTSPFMDRKYSLLSATTSMISHSPMADNTTASLDKITCPNYVDFVNCRKRLGQFSCFKTDSNFLDNNLKLIKIHDNRESSKCHIGKSRFQLVHTIEASADHCSKKVWYRRKLVTSADTNNV